MVGCARWVWELESDSELVITILGSWRCAASLNRKLKMWGDLTLISDGRKTGEQNSHIASKSDGRKK